MRTLLINECALIPQKLVSVLNIDGMPITARFIEKRITQVLSNENVTPIKATESEE